MADIKANLSIYVQGAKMLSSQECEKNPNNSYNVTKIIVGNGKQRETLSVKTRKQQLIKREINLCSAAYNYMLKNPAPKYNLKQWGRMTEDERLRAHFALIVHDLNGVRYHYKVYKN